MNIYWPVYLNIESQVIALMNSIHMEDCHLEVYSSHISDLILRSATEIESIAKELYIKNGGKKKSGIRFDYDALEFLESKWLLSRKKVSISAYNCFFSKKELLPFEKKTEKSFGKKSLTFLWNNAYQNLKHDRSKGFKFGNVESLFQVLAALFILNIYYQDRTIPLNPHQKYNPFDASLGSSVFSVSFYERLSISIDNIVTKEKGMEEAVFIIKASDKSSEKLRELLREVYDAKVQFVLKAIVGKEQGEKIEIDDLIELISIENGKSDVLPSTSADKSGELLDAAISSIPESLLKQLYYEKQNVEYEAILNKNDFSPENNSFKLHLER